MQRAILLTTSSILAAIVAALATIALVLVASGNSAAAASSLVNGNFETGDLSGWTVNTTASGGDASANGYGVWFCSAAECWYPLFYSAQEGTYFAQLTPGKLSENTTISQPFTASKGDRVSGWAFIQADDYVGSTYCDSTGEVVIKSDSGTTVATPFAQCAYGVYYVWQGAPSGWQYWEHTFTEDTGAGKFKIEARVRSIVDNPAPSAMGLDDVKTSTLAPDITKPSTSATRSVEPDAAGWNKENVTVKLNATDNEGGWGVKKITYSASGAQTIAQTDSSSDSVDVALDKEGTTTLTYYAIDNAGNVEASKTLTVKIDKTAPTVKSTSPADQATNVSLSAPISATFLESGSGIDPSTLNTNTFKVKVAPWTSSGDVPVSGKTSYDEASKTVTFTPDSPLADETTYMATVYETWGTNPGVADKANNKLYPSYSWVFTVDDSAPTTVDKTAPTVSTLNATSVTSTGVPLRKTDFKATFSEKMDPKTLNTSTFKLFKCSSTTSTTCTTQITDAPVTPSGDGLSATLNPFGSKSTSLQASTRYKVVVTTGAKDVAGNALDQDSSTTGNQQKVGYFTTGSS